MSKNEGGRVKIIREREMKSRNDDENLKLKIKLRNFKILNVRKHMKSSLETTLIQINGTTICRRC